jgi:hypothetical protein
VPHGHHALVILKTPSAALALARDVLEHRPVRRAVVIRCASNERAVRAVDRGKVLVWR